MGCISGHGYEFNVCIHRPIQSTDIEMECIESEKATSVWKRRKIREKLNINIDDNDNDGEYGQLEREYEKVIIIN